MALHELLEEFDVYLDEEVKTISFPSQLYRGDNRDWTAITAAGGFFPKKNGGDAPSIWALLNHCAVNGYGGPFISTTEDPDIAREFGGNLYGIDAGMDVVSEENWTKLEEYYKRFKDEMDTGLGDIGERNRTSNYMGNFLWPALQYHKAQREQLVIPNIPIGHIHLQNP